MAKQKRSHSKTQVFHLTLKYFKYFDDLHFIILIMNKNSHLVMID